jgi:hypothetical protein
LWRDGDRQQWLSSESLITKFLEKYPTDPKSSLLRLHLAWIRLEQKRYIEVKALVDAERPHATLLVEDWVTVIDGARIRAQGQPKAALNQLLQLNGKIVDVTLRELWSIETIKAALESSMFETAVDIMVDYRAHGREERIVTTQSQIETWVLRLPVLALRSALNKLAILVNLPVVDEGQKQARAFMFETIRERLASVALERKDSKLANLVLESAPPRFKRSELGESLRRLTDAAAPPVKTLQAVVGILLEMQDDFSSRRSAEVITGALRALDDESSAFPIRLASREIRDTSPRNIELGLNSLVSDGAAIVIAGVTQATATIAAKFAKIEQVTVVTLTDMQQENENTPYLFRVAEASDIFENMFESVDRSGPHRITMAHAACSSNSPDAPWMPALLTRNEWLISTDENCAKKIADQLLSVKSPPRVWLGPEAVSVAERFPFVSVVTSPNLFESTLPLVQKWQERFRRQPFFYEALGFDIVRLCRMAIGASAIESVTEARLIAEKRAKIRDLLGQAHSTLLTSNASGFDASRHLNPSLSRFDLSSSKTTGSVP